MTNMDDPFAYYVPQTPRDSSHSNSFFRCSSPNSSSTRLISTLHIGISLIHNIGRPAEAVPPLQLRVSTLEDTLQSVHTTVATLETTMVSEIVTLL
jgi:hypothetical protein